jgi:L-amino acid N-acyltransferase YncA
MKVRLAALDDAAAVQAIYAPAVTDTAISFELVPPTVAEMRDRIAATLPAYPWLVAVEADHQVVGYAYAHAFAERAAYGWSVETSIYLDPNARRRGVGRRLYEVLFALLEAQGYRQAFAGATLPNPASVALHERMGFEPVAVYRRVGWKNGVWHDVGWWQRAITAGDHAPATPVPLDQLPAELIERLGSATG